MPSLCQHRPAKLTPPASTALSATTTTRASGRPMQRAARTASTPGACRRDCGRRFCHATPTASIWSCCRQSHHAQRALHHRVTCGQTRAIQQSANPTNAPINTNALIGHTRPIGHAHQPTHGAARHPRGSAGQHRWGPWHPATAMTTWSKQPQAGHENITGRLASGLRACNVWHRSFNFNLPLQHETAAQQPLRGASVDKVSGPEPCRVPVGRKDSRFHPRSGNQL